MSVPRLDAKKAAIKALKFLTPSPLCTSQLLHNFVSDHRFIKLGIESRVGRM